jgi:hypothetical protein
MKSRIAASVRICIRDYLLRRTHLPLVQVRPSQIPGARLGVFVSGAVSSPWSPSQVIEEDQVLCLYPGVYSPGLPMTCIADGSGDEGFRLIGAEDDFDETIATPTPSGVPPSENSYLLHLTEQGGYLDGRALQDPMSLRDLTENPSCCAHYINHANDKRPNVRIVSFLWHDILTATTVIDNNNPSETWFAIPNVVRFDRTPWYWDELSQELILHDGSAVNCGAAAVATTCLYPDDELLLDYSLKDPLPKWAYPWYQRARTK